MTEAGILGESGRFSKSAAFVKGSVTKIAGFARAFEFASLMNLFGTHVVVLTKHAAALVLCSAVAE
jgi:hypothetical protein